MTFKTQGDFAGAGDVSIEFETYDQGISLLTITIEDAGIWPIEVSNSNALLLADAIMRIATSDEHASEETLNAAMRAGEHACERENFAEIAPGMYECTTCHKQIPAFALAEYEPFFSDE